MGIINVTGWERLEQLAHLFNECRKFYNQEDDIQKSKEFISERIKNNDSTIFLAMNEEDKAVGFTQIYPVFSSVSCKKDFILNDLYVLPESRNNGAATRLLQQAQKFSAENGGKGLALETAEDNPARKLYEWLGREEDPEFIHYYWTYKANR